MSYKKPLLTPQQKLKLAGDLFNFVFRIKSFQLKKSHPDWSDQKIREETLRLIEDGGS